MLKNLAALVLTFTFKPTIPEFTSSSKFEVGWVGGAAKSLQVRGHSKKIFGRFNEGLLNFGAARRAVVAPG